jgi:hypothetical protein
VGKSSDRNQPMDIEAGHRGSLDDRQPTVLSAA